MQKELKTCRALNALFETYSSSIQALCIMKSYDVMFINIVKPIYYKYNLLTHFYTRKSENFNFKRVIDI